MSNVTTISITPARPIDRTVHPVTESGQNGVRQYFTWHQSDRAPRPTLATQFATVEELELEAARAIRAGEYDWIETPTAYHTPTRSWRITFEEAVFVAGKYGQRYAVRLTRDDETGWVIASYLEPKRYINTPLYATPEAAYTKLVSDYELLANVGTGALTRSDYERECEQYGLAPKSDPSGVSYGMRYGEFFPPEYPVESCIATVLLRRRAECVEAQRALATQAERSETPVEQPIPNPAIAAALERGLTPVIVLRDWETGLPVAYEHAVTQAGVRFNAATCVEVGSREVATEEHPNWLLEAT
jgi:hypothetical protein